MANVDFYLRGESGGSINVGVSGREVLDEGSDIGVYLLVRRFEAG